MTTLTKVQVRPTNTVEAFNEFGRKRQITTFTLKGRLEFAKDAQAVMLAASKLLFVSGLKADHNSVEISFGLGLDGNVDPDQLKKVKTIVSHFGDLLIADYHNSPEQFKGKGIEAHVFIESLKPIDEFDGKRDGFLSHRIR